MITRRRFATATGGMLAAATWGAVTAGRAVGAWGGLAEQFARIEVASGGRLGVEVLDTGTGARAGHRNDERFPMCSTFKMLAAAATLARVDAGKETLDRRVQVTTADLLSYAPAAKEHVGKGMTIAELCDAAVTLSDNTAANLLLASLGGPAALTDFTRTLGDSVTRLDRIEPELNEAVAGDPRDTTSPTAMLADLNATVLGTALSAGSRERLTAWLVGCRTGDKRLRAGLPQGWRVGDKTGTGNNGTANDIAVIWPPQRAPLVLTVYLTGTPASAAERDATHAAVARAVAAALG